MIAKLCRKYYPSQTEGELEVFDEDSGLADLELLEWGIVPDIDEQGNLVL